MAPVKKSKDDFKDQSRSSDQKNGSSSKGNSFQGNSGKPNRGFSSNGKRACFECNSTEHMIARCPIRLKKNQDSSSNVNLMSAEPTQGTSSKN